MNKTILAAVILVAAAFAGVVIVGDDTDAATYTQVVYKIDDNNVKAVAISGSEFVVMSPEELGLGYSGTFNYWKDGTNVFIPGQSYPTASASGTTLTLVAEIILPTTVSFIVDDVATPVTPSDGTVAIPGDISTVKDGYDFKGWKYSKTGDVLSNDAVAALTGVAAGETFTAVFEKIFKVSWVVEGVTLAEGTSKVLNKPVNDPSKQNYTFAGWFDAAGIRYTVDDSTTADINEAYKFTGDVVFSAKFIPANMTVTFQVGEFKSTQTVLYGEKAMKPELPEGYVAWMLGEEEFNFNTPITENITLTAKAGEVAQIYNITFEIADKAPVVQKSDSMVIPDTAREGYMFQGWVVKGESQYVDPAELVKTITADTTFVAVYKAVEVVEYTVTFVNGDEVVDTVKVVKDALVDEIDAPEGMFWLFDFETPITGDVTIEAKPLTVTVQFAVGEKVYNAYTQTVAYGEKIDVTKLADFIFPEGYDSWGYDFNEPVTADMTVYAKAIPAPEKEPAFYQTPMGQCAIILAVFVVGLVFYGIFTGRITVPKFKISRAEKTEAPVEQPQEEKKP